jgi:predicted acyltransferase
VTTPAATAGWPGPDADAGGPGPGPAAAQVETGRRDRVLSLDATRGLAVAILLVAMHAGPREALPEQLMHPEWHGLTFADLFFPLFLFAVGAAMPFAQRASSFGGVARRAAVLGAIGIVLTSARHMDLTIPGVLQRIALAYVLAWLVLKLPGPVQLGLCAGAVAGYWLAFLAAAGPGEDPWGRSGTFAHVLNTWLFGGFRTEGLPQGVMGTVNVLAGAFTTQLILRVPDRRALLRKVALWCVLLIAAGLLMALGAPVNKRIWSPSFTVLTVGTSLFWFALAFWAIDIRGWRRITRPLVHLGTNAIAVYVLVIAALVAIPPFRGPLDDVAHAVLSPVAVTWIWALSWLLLGWLFCRTLHNRGIFIKV